MPCLFHRSIFLYVLLCLCCAGAGAAEEPSTLRDRIKARLEARRGGAVESGQLGPGTHVLKLRHDGLERKYLLHIPAGLDPRGPTPLVLAFHGGGGHAQHMADDANYGLIAKAEREGFVIAFPNGYSRLPGGKMATWNAGGCCGDARDRKVDDVGFARALVLRIAQLVPVDKRRTYATGMSNGGMMSHRLACEAADVFAAVASVAGTDASELCTPSRPIAVLHIHARDDSHVLFEGGVGKDAFRDGSKVMEFVSVPETMKRWAARDSCSTPPQRTLEKPGAICERWTPCAGKAELELCVTEEGGHSWPGAPGVRRGKAGASKALDANEVIWGFFSRHVL